MFYLAGKKDLKMVARIISALASTDKHSPFTPNYIG